MSPRLFGPLVVVCLLAASAACGQDGAATTNAAAAADTVTESGSWLTRAFKRYLVDTPQEGDLLDGQAVQAVDKYSRHIGKPIEVVIVSQVARFDQEWNQDKATGQRLLNTATRPIHAYTQDRVIREYLLFEQGQVVDPFALADSERMLRQLDFINDVRITLIPLQGEVETIAVVVEVRDKWPFGITGTVKDVDRYVASLYFSNLGGLGIRLENRLIYRGDREPDLGYRGTVSKRNVRGTFIDLALQYEDSWERLQRQIGFERDLVHPAIKWVGGAFWEDTDVRDNEGIPRRFYLGDYWAGRTIQLSEGRADLTAARPVLVPAARFNQTIFSERPSVDADTNRAYHDTKSLLGSVAYQRLKYYKTSYLYRMGETEDVPAGLAAKLSAGYEWREFYDRTGVFTELVYASIRNAGDIWVAGARLGGHYRDHVFEEGNLWLTVSYISPLMGKGKYKHRFLSRLDYHRAINWYADTALMLGDRTGIRGLENNRVLGSQRLVLKLDSRVFTPWNLLGFRFMVSAFSDIGAVAGEKEPLLQAKFYGNLGVGIRIENPNLVLPEVEIRFLLVNNIGNGDLGLDFDVGNPSYPEYRIPSTKPGSFFFQ
jgi:hypothetical protein